MPLRNSVLIPFVGQAFDGSGAPVNPAAEAALAITLADLAWWGELLADGRRRGELPPGGQRMAAASAA